MRGTIRALLVAGLTVWSMCGMFAWILRDGLGPNAVESDGWEALRKAFRTYYWGPIFILLAVAERLWARHIDNRPKLASHEADADKPSATAE